MRNLLKVIIVFIFGAGVASMILATPVSVVTAVYFWGGVGFEVGVAAWSGVKLWLWMFLGGATSLVLSYISLHLIDSSLLPKFPLSKK